MKSTLYNNVNPDLQMTSETVQHRYNCCMNHYQVIRIDASVATLTFSQNFPTAAFLRLSRYKSEEIDHNVKATKTKILPRNRRTNFKLKTLHCRYIQLIETDKIGCPNFEQRSTMRKVLFQLQPEVLKEQLDEPSSRRRHLREPFQSIRSILWRNYQECLSGAATTTDRNYCWQNYQNFLRIYR